ncbi:MAG: oligosaccharide flippase family protein, partial [Planctomycetaceae bacterium]|nr:oligosaccharide flippase family protein [Planctomycetaceae bacterium]
AFWSIVGNAFGKVFTFVAMIFVIRILGKEASGEFGWIRATATTFVVFSNFGMGLTATKYIAELLHTNKERVGRIISLTYLLTFFTSLIVAITFYLSAPWFCETRLNAPHLTAAMQLGAVLLFLVTFMGTQNSVMAGFQDFRGLAITIGIIGVLSLPIYVLGAYWYGVYGIMVSVIVCAIFNVIINSMFIYRNVKKYQLRYNFRKAYKEYPVLLNSNLPIVICNILYAGMIWLTQMMLRLQPNGTAELGEYYAAQNIQIAFCFIPSILMSVFFPNLCEVGGTGQNRRYWNVVKKGLILQTIVSLLVLLPLFLFPNFFMKINGVEFSGNGLVLLSIGIWGLLCILCNVGWCVMVDQKKTWFTVFVLVIEVTIALTLSHLLLNHQWGNIGIITALITGRMINLILVTYYLHKQSMKTEIQFT